MDAVRFDTLARTLARAGTRRRLVRLLTSLLLAGALAPRLPEETDARKRREKRKDRHRQKQDRRETERTQDQNKRDRQQRNEQKRRKQPPTPDCTPTTCATQGTNCGSIADGCGGTLDCGPEACGDGFSCTANVCRCGDGTAVCDGACCQPGEVCQNGDGPCCTPESSAETCAGTCGNVLNNCGQPVTCPPCPPGITTFTATPATIDRGATPPETSSLAWSTSNATTCSINNGVGSVPCNGNTSVGPGATTTYTLSASGAGGGPVTADTTVTVQYCHAITRTGGTCPNASELCDNVPIDPTSSDQAHAACDACFGAGACIAGNTVQFAQSWVGGGEASITHFTYTNPTNPMAGCPSYTSVAGDITTGQGCFVSRWAP